MSDSSDDSFDVFSSDEDSNIIFDERDIVESPELDDEEGEGGDDAFVRPYQYEPEAHAQDHDGDHDEQQQDDDNQHDEIDHNVLENWCTCRVCQVMPTVAECVCCRQVDQFNEKLEGSEHECITQHEGFDPVCLNPYVLDTAWLQYRQQYGRKAYDGPTHKKRRHIAYRQIIRWTYGYLGKDIRVVVPSCVVCKIRAFFPPPGVEDNFIFRGFVNAGDD